MQNRFKRLAQAAQLNLEEIRKVEQDTDLTYEARQRKAAELMEARKNAIEAAVSEIQDSYEADIARLRAKVYPKQQGNGEDMAAVARELRYSRHERRLEKQWSAEGPPTIEEYQEVLENGDDVEAEVYEALAPLHVSPMVRPAMEEAMRHGKQERHLANLSPDQRKAYEELLQLEQDYSSTKTNLGIQVEQLLRGGTELYDPTADSGLKLIKA